MLVRRHFDPDLESVPQARQFVASSLREATPAPPDSLIDDALLAVDELATNAVNHAGTNYEVIVEIDTCVRVAVSDYSPTRPAPRQVDSWDEHGRGLAIVDLTAQRWGVVPQGTGKRVWWEAHFVS